MLGWDPHVRFRFATVLALMVSGAAPGAAIASDRQSAGKWLMKIGSAAQELNYDGVFVYRHGDQMEVMRIIHKKDGEKSRERLVSLNGSAREVIRDRKAVYCYFPDENAVVVEHRKIDSHNFPALIPDRISGLDLVYRVELGSIERVAGRLAQRVLAKPKDALRYGHSFWADLDTGLLLRADLLGENGETLGQFLFTNVAVGGQIPDTLLEPDEQLSKQLLRRREGQRGVGERAETAEWIWKDVPSGFRKTGRFFRPASEHAPGAQHHVFSDGLATVSVFIEKGGKQLEGVEGPSSMGAVNAFVARSGDYQITAVGEVPPTTVGVFVKGASLSR